MMEGSGDSAPDSRASAPAGREPSRADRAHAELRRMIMRAEVPPGERLAEVAIAEWLGISRTPVREALQRLEREDLVRRGSRGGFTVAGLTRREVRETFELRLLIDTALFQRAAARISRAQAQRLVAVAERMRDVAHAGDVDGWTAVDGGFHEIVDTAADQQLLAAHARRLREQIHRFALLSTALQGRLPACAEEHIALARAVQTGDGEGVAVAVADHIAATQASVGQLAEAPFVGGGDIWSRLQVARHRDGGSIAG